MNANFSPTKGTSPSWPYLVSFSLPVQSGSVWPVSCVGISEGFCGRKKGWETKY